ncbi:MAG: hypothetical protein OXI30_04470, partial [Chloroflexota bacterium]|nr:hypothetical protein [Chloroflexota bacterium]
VAANCPRSVTMLNLSCPQQQAREGELSAAGRKVFCVGGGMVARVSAHFALNWEFQSKASHSYSSIEVTQIAQLIRAIASLAKNEADQ